LGDYHAVVLSDVSRGQTDVSNNAGTAGISHGDSRGTYLGVRGTKCVMDVTDGVGATRTCQGSKWTQ